MPTHKEKMMALPAPFYQLVYDEQTGEVLSFWNRMRGECPDSPSIEVSIEDHARVQPNAHRFRVIDKRLVEVDDVPVEERPKRRDVNEALIAGLVIDGTCYAIAPNLLSLLTLDLARNAKQCRAVTHTANGNQVAQLTKDEAKVIASKITDHLADLHCG